MTILSAFLLLLLVLTVQSSGFNNPGIYDPTGRLMQLESASKASERGGSLLAASGSEAIVLLTLPAASSKDRLLVTTHSVRGLSRRIGVVSVGITSDAAYLIDKCFDMIVSNEKAFDSKPSVGRIATAIAEVMHDRTEDMASRPFGASLCLFGVDPSRSRPELFEVTPSGACTQRRVVGIGKFGSRLMKAWQQRRQLETAEDGAQDTDAAQLVEQCLSALRKVLQSSAEECSENAAVTEPVGGAQDDTVLKDCRARLHVIPLDAWGGRGQSASDLRGAEGWEVDSGVVREALTSGDYSRLRALVHARCAVDKQ